MYRVDEDGTFEPFATDLGVACGLAFAPDGTLFVGDRSGTIFRVDRHGKASPFASIPPSVAAFHLAMGPDGGVYVTAPTLSAYDSVYRVAPDGTVSTVADSFGRPQGLAFDTTGAAARRRGAGGRQRAVPAAASAAARAARRGARPGGRCRGSFRRPRRLLERDRLPRHGAALVVSAPSRRGCRAGLQACVESLTCPSCFSENRSPRSCPSPRMRTRAG